MRLTRRQFGTLATTSAAVHASIYNLFNSERSFYTRQNFKLNPVAALAEWRGLGAE